MGMKEMGQARPEAGILFLKRTRESAILALQPGALCLLLNQASPPPRQCENSQCPTCGPMGVHGLPAKDITRTDQAESAGACTDTSRMPRTSQQPTGQVGQVAAPFRGRDG